LAKKAMKKPAQKAAKKVAKKKINPQRKNVKKQSLHCAGLF